MWNCCFIKGLNSSHSLKIEQNERGTSEDQHRIDTHNIIQYFQRDTSIKHVQKLFEGMGL